VNKESQRYPHRRDGLVFHVPLTDSAGDFGKDEEPEGANSYTKHPIQSIVEASTDRETRLSRNRHNHHGGQGYRVSDQRVECTQEDEDEDL
jgi:hypothetical protein